MIYFDLLLHSFRSPLFCLFFGCYFLGATNFYCWSMAKSRTFGLKFPSLWLQHRCYYLNWYSFWLIGSILVFKNWTVAYTPIVTIFAWVEWRYDVLTFYFVLSLRVNILFEFIVLEMKLNFFSSFNFLFMFRLSF